VVCLHSRPPLLPLLPLLLRPAAALAALVLGLAPQWCGEAAGGVLGFLDGVFVLSALLFLRCGMRRRGDCGTFIRQYACQHTSATSAYAACGAEETVVRSYVSIRVSIRQQRQHTSAYAACGAEETVVRSHVSMLTYEETARVVGRVAAYVSAYVSIRQHTSAYVICIRKD
jgi:hypothetical protein